MTGFWKAMPPLAIDATHFAPRRGRVSACILATAEVFESKIDRSDPAFAASAVYVASLQCGPSVSSVTKATGLPYDFCCAVAQNLWRCEVWRPDGRVTVEFDSNDEGDNLFAETSIFLMGQVGVGELTYAPGNPETENPQ